MNGMLPRTDCEARISLRLADKVGQLLPQRAEFLATQEVSSIWSRPIDSSYTSDSLSYIFS
jgi:hypothetical protein